MDQTGYVSEDWINAGFPNEKSRKRQEKHLVEYGDISFDEYVQGARELLSAEVSDDIDEFRNNSGAIYKYKRSTNDFVIGVNGYVITRFQPKDGEEYWKGEKERESI